MLAAEAEEVLRAALVLFLRAGGRSRHGLNDLKCLVVKFVVGQIIRIILFSLNLFYETWPKTYTCELKLSSFDTKSRYITRITMKRSIHMTVIIKCKHTLYLLISFIQFITVMFKEDRDWDLGAGSNIL